MRGISKRAGQGVDTAISLSLTEIFMLAEEIKRLVPILRATIQNILGSPSSQYDLFLTSNSGHFALCIERLKKDMEAFHFLATEISTLQKDAQAKKSGGE